MLGSKAIKWNFTKFLVDRAGKVVKRYAPQTKPERSPREIESLLPTRTGPFSRAARCIAHAHLSLALTLAASLSTVRLRAAQSGQARRQRACRRRGRKERRSPTRAAPSAPWRTKSSANCSRAPPKFAAPTATITRRIAGFALIELGGAAPVPRWRAGELVDCRGQATLRLAAGLRVAGGRTTLGGESATAWPPARAAAVTLGQSDAIAIPLATLTQSRAAAPAAEPVGRARAGRRRSPRAGRTARNHARAASPAAVAGAARPSFDCRRARTPASARCATARRWPRSTAPWRRNIAARYRQCRSDGARACSSRPATASSPIATAALG